MKYQYRTPLSVLMKCSEIGFFTRRVLQRWERGEISTYAAVELLQQEEAARIIGAWRDTQTPS
jgi:hypothetical protein